MKISNLPKSIPIISTISVRLFVVGPVNPMERPTVPREDANSNIASLSEQDAVNVISYI